MMLHRIQNSTGAGLYANFLAALGACDLIDRMGGHVNVDFREGYYLDPSKGPNWWNYYYRQLQAAELPFTPPLIDQDPINGFDSIFPNWIQFNQHAVRMGRDRSHFLIDKYIRLSEEAIDYIEDFKDSVSWNEKDYHIGVHVRKTNKTDEGAPPLPNDFVIEQIRAWSSWEKGITKIFLATDDARTVTDLTKAFRLSLYTLPALRSNNRYAIYNRSNADTLNPDAYRLGMEAVADTHLIASCDVLLATDSMMSIVAGKMMKPDRPIVNMTARYKGCEDASNPFADHIQYVYGKHKMHPRLAELL